MNVVSIDSYRQAKHGLDQIVYDRLKGSCSIARINRAQRMCAANIRNGTPEDSAIDAAVHWAAVVRSQVTP